MEHSHHVVVTLAGEPFLVPPLVVLVSHISGHHELLLATQHHRGHPSVQSATEIKIRVMNICPCWMSLDETITMSTEIGMLSQTSGEN